MTGHNDFEVERDEALGRSLRQHYQPSVAGEDAFVARVMSRIRRDRIESSWDVLARWAPAGMAAAALLALAAGLWLGFSQAPPEQVAADPVELLAPDGPVTAELVLTAVLAADRPGSNGDR